MRMPILSRLIAPCMMFLLLLTGGHQGYVAYKDYKKVVNKLAAADNKVNKRRDEGKQFALFNAAIASTRQIAAVIKPLTAEVQGIIASDESWMSFAMIKTQAGQQSYREGDKLSGYDDAWIEKIGKDNVVVHYEGASQVLALKNPDYFKGVPDNPPEKLAAKSTLSELHLSDYFVLKPVVEKGELQGYQINPRNASPVFMKSGFQQGDIVVKVDATDMTQQNQANNVITQWSRMNAADVVVLRHAHLQNIKVNVLNN